MSNAPKRKEDSDAPKPGRGGKRGKADDGKRAKRVQRPVPLKPPHDDGRLQAVEPPPDDDDWLQAVEPPPDDDDKNGWR